MAGYVVIIALGLIALAAVAYPFLAGHARYRDQAALDADIRRYRDAVRAGTVCPRCKGASPAGSRFCIECGHEL